MHYPIYIFTKNFPTDSLLEQIMEPYNEEHFYKEDSSNRNRSDISWDYYLLGGRYGGFLKIKCKEDDDYYDWMCFTPEPKAGKLFRSAMLEEINRTNSLLKVHYSNVNEIYNFLYSGYRDGYIYADGCRIKDLYNREELIKKGYGFIAFEKDISNSRERWINDDLVENEKYEEELSSMMDFYNDGYLTVLDIHD